MVDGLKRNDINHGVSVQDEIAQIYVSELFMPLFRKLLRFNGITPDIKEGDYIAEDVLDNTQVVSTLTEAVDEPKCDCGGVKCKVPCADWCSVRQP